MYWIMNSFASFWALTRVSVPTTGSAKASMTTIVSPSSLPCMSPMISYAPPDLACMTCTVLLGAAAGLSKRGAHHLDERDGRDADLFEVVRVGLPRGSVQDRLLGRLVVAKDVVDRLDVVVELEGPLGDAGGRGRRLRRAAAGVRLAPTQTHEAGAPHVSMAAILVAIRAVGRWPSQDAGCGVMSWARGSFGLTLSGFLRRQELARGALSGRERGERGP